MLADFDDSHPFFWINYKDIHKEMTKHIKLFLVQRLVLLSDYLRIHLADEIISL